MRRWRLPYDVGDAATVAVRLLWSRGPVPPYRHADCLPTRYGISVSHCHSLPTGLRQHEHSAELRRCTSGVPTQGTPLGATNIRQLVYNSGSVRADACSGARHGNKGTLNVICTATAQQSSQERSNF